MKNEILKECERLNAPGETEKKVQTAGRQTANSVLDEDLQQQKPLYLNLWYENEICILFGETNSGKSTFAVQIADTVAKQHKMDVLYFDFELSKPQFQARYKTADGKKYVFRNSLFWYCMDNIMADRDDLENTDGILQYIENEVKETTAKIIIIDNLTSLCDLTEKGEIASVLMKQLRKLKRKNNLSILILGHTPKRNGADPLTLKDLGGSSKLANYADSVFVVGKSQSDENKRYVKQLKARNAGITYGADSVIVAELSKEIEGYEGFLFFDFDKDTATEAEMLKQPSEMERSMLANEVLTLHTNGKSYREIAELKHCSTKKIFTLIQQARRENEGRDEL